MCSLGAQNTIAYGQRIDETPWTISVRNRSSSKYDDKSPISEQLCEAVIAEVDNDSSMNYIPENQIQEVQTFLLRESTGIVGSIFHTLGSKQPTEQAQMLLPAD